MPYTIKLFAFFAAFLIVQIADKPVFAQSTNLQFAGSTIIGSDIPGATSLGMDFSMCSEFYAVDVSNFKKEYEKSIATTNNKIKDQTGQNHQMVGHLMNTKCNASKYVARCVMSGKDKNGQPFTTTLYSPDLMGQGVVIAQQSCSNTGANKPAFEGAHIYDTQFRFEAL